MSQHISGWVALGESRNDSPSNPALLPAGSYGRSNCNWPRCAFRCWGRRLVRFCQDRSSAASFLATVRRQGQSAHFVGSMYRNHHEAIPFSLSGCQSAVIVITGRCIGPRPRRQFTQIEPHLVSKPTTSRIFALDQVWEGENGLWFLLFCSESSKAGCGMTNSVCLLVLTNQRALEVRSPFERPSNGSLPCSAER